MVIFIYEILKKTLQIKFSFSQPTVGIEYCIVQICKRYAIIIT